MLWEWDCENNTVRCNWVGKGHERSIETLKSDDKGTMIASGSWDGHIKLWATIPSEKIENVEDNKPNTCVSEILLLIDCVFHATYV